jgi:phospholipid/cholesterol/gamma-HCH transport system permease protein
MRRRRLSGAPAARSEKAGLEVIGQPDAVVLRLSGSWRLSLPLPQADFLEREIENNPSVRRIGFDAEGLGGWDSGLLLFLGDVTRTCVRRRVELVPDGLPAGVRRLMALAATRSEKEGVREEAKNPLLARVGDLVTGLWDALIETLDFLGEVTAAFLKMAGGRPGFRLADFLRILQDCGVGALPIVSLISVLVGLILAFVGSIQLRMFGAQIYIANLVGISMTRAMGAIMTGIIMAGRTGASYAAGIGTMQVNEEIDALRTSGISPIEFLVLPRVAATALMMPLLTLYADLMGILGGVIVAVIGFDISPLEYFQQTKEAVNLANIGIGAFSGVVFGVLVGLTGCLRGMQCGRSASAVGSATTRAVVSGIVSIIVATAVITVLCDVINI